MLGRYLLLDNYIIERKTKNKFKAKGANFILSFFNYLKYLRFLVSPSMCKELYGYHFHPLSKRKIEQTANQYNFLNYQRTVITGYTTTSEPSRNMPR